MARKLSTCHRLTLELLRERNGQLLELSPQKKPRLTGSSCWSHRVSPLHGSEEVKSRDAINGLMNYCSNVQAKFLVGFAKRCIKNHSYRACLNELFFLCHAEVCKYLTFVRVWNGQV